MQQRITQFYDDEIRSRYFRGLEFAGPQGDPGWFGPAARSGTCIPTCPRWCSGCSVRPTWNGST